MASRLALKSVTAMVQHHWVRCNDNIKQVSRVCPEWLRDRDPSMTLECIRSLSCHNGALASVNLYVVHSAGNSWSCSCTCLQPVSCIFFDATAIALLGLYAS
ncbi:TPA: hypothetical protein ACH3X2_001063 [Trebouxia sp. C0005]